MRDSLKTINEIAIELHEANQLTHKLIPTATPVPTYTLYPTYTPYPTLTPLPTPTPLPPPSPDGQHSLEEANDPGTRTGCKRWSANVRFDENNEAYLEEVCREYY